MVVISIRVDDKAVLRKLGDLQNFMYVQLPSLTNAQATEGARYAASIAPKDTGALIQAIHAIPGKGSSRGRSGRFIGNASIISRTPDNIRGNNPRNYPYQVALEYGRTVNVRGGRHQRYMRDTVTWLEEKYPQLVSERLTNVIRQ